MAEAELAQGIDVASTSTTATVMYNNTSGSAKNKIIVRFMPDRGASAFVYVELYRRSNAAATIDDGDLEGHADVPPNGFVDIPVPVLPNNDHLLASAETANVLRCNVIEVDP